MGSPSSMIIFDYLRAPYLTNQKLWREPFQIHSTSIFSVTSDDKKIYIVSKKLEQVYLISDCKITWKWINLGKSNQGQYEPKMKSLNRETLPKSRKSLENIRHKNINRLIFAQLNINSLTNKFDSLQHIIKKNIDVLLISETKIGSSSFPSAQFYWGYATPYRLDRNANGGGILLYLREDISSTLLDSDSSIEGLFTEIRWWKKTWLFCSSYHRQKNLIANHLNCNDRNLDSQLRQYEHFILMGDFNVKSYDATMKNFCQIYGCKNTVKNKTCFKNPINLICIYFIFTNRPERCDQFETIETGLSDFHKLSLMVMKMFYKNQKAKVIQYRKYKEPVKFSCMN